MLLHEEWLARRAELPPQHQVLADLLIARFETIAAGYHNRQMEEIQRLERRLEILRGQIEAMRPADE